MQVYKKLGFSHLETTEIVHTLNNLLANYQVHYQNLRAFHWNVEGHAFFELHEQFEIEYKAVQAHIDQIAERIRIFGQKPLSSYSSYLKHAEIVEKSDRVDSNQMVQEVLDEFETLLSFMIAALDASKSIGDSGTMNMIMRFIERMEKRHWMLSAYMKASNISIPNNLS